MAESQDWEHHQVVAGDFLLTAYSRIDDPSDPSLVVYIEGDGYAWRSRTELSDDPTPRIPRAFALAVRDPAPNRVYIARPCQFLDAEALASCSSDYWSLARYAPEVVEATDLMIDKFVRLADAHDLTLVGYSGGGTIAALVAARRSDVDELITVVANLDHEVWTELQGVSELKDSLNAADVADDLARLRQIHFVGADDTNITVEVVESYVARMPDNNRAQIVVVEDMAHNCCWIEVWPDLLETYDLSLE